MRDMKSRIDVGIPEFAAMPRAFSARLSADAERLRSDPPALLHARIMVSLASADRSSGTGVPPVMPWGATRRWRPWALAACLLVGVGLVFVIAQRNDSVADDSNALHAQDAPPIVHDEGALVADPGNDTRERRGSALASIQSIFEPLPRIEREITAPLRTELDRLASAGEHLLRSTFAAMPSSLRSAGTR